MTNSDPTPTIPLCSCGHVERIHSGPRACSVKGCTCNDFFLDGYILEETPAAHGESIFKEFLDEGGAFNIDAICDGYDEE
jgi:hypothetical protein